MPHSLTETPVRIQDPCISESKLAAKTPPPVRTKSKSSKNICAVRLDLIVDGKDEAIVCEGECQQWIHRGCASISKKLLATLTASTEPFLCLTCSRAGLQEQRLKFC